MQVDDFQVLLGMIGDLRRTQEACAALLAAEMRQCTSMICATIYVSFATGHDGDGELMTRLQAAMRKLLEPEQGGDASGPASAV